jgi:hypothetical protein
MSESFKVIAQMLNDLRALQEKYAEDLPQLDSLWEEFRRQRARRFLEDTLRHGPRHVTEVEEAAVKAHVDPATLEQARADLGVVTSRANTGNTLSVQWSLPG